MIRTISNILLEKQFGAKKKDFVLEKTVKDKYMRFLEDII